MRGATFAHQLALKNTAGGSCNYTSGTNCHRHCRHQGPPRGRGAVGGGALSGRGWGPGWRAQAPGGGGRRTHGDAAACCLGRAKMARWRWHLGQGRSGLTQSGAQRVRKRGDALSRIQSVHHGAPCRVIGTLCRFLCLTGPPDRTLVGIGPSTPIGMSIWCNPRDLARNNSGIKVSECRAVRAEPRDCPSSAL